MSSMAKRTRKSVGEKLQTMREEWGLERQQMATRLGLTVSTYYKYEIGVSMPGMQTLNLLVNEHGISLDWLFFDKGPRFFKNKSRLDLLEQEVEKTRQALVKAEQERDNAVPGYRDSLKTGVAELFDQIQADQRLYLKVLTLYQDYKDNQ